MTYAATVRVPSWSTCLMSAVQTSAPKSVSDDDDGSAQFSKEFRFEQQVPIPSYLLAMAVGKLERREISKRCAVWSEPNVVEAAAYEFAQTDDFLSTAEQIAGTDYVWGRYDVLCLPPSCPYGGMENPCLTFVTPTLLAGDRSLADVIAHEIAHSWTGNLVTNATWDHFWLNEGWTTWFQRKIMALIHNDDRYLDLDALDGLKHLKDTVLGGEMPLEFTSLVLDIGDRDPDDSYSAVAYERGFLFLTVLERCVGSKAFLQFFQDYVKKFAYKTVTSDDFIQYFMDYFGDGKSKKDVASIDWHSWYYAQGMPPQIPEFDKTFAQASEDLAAAWLAVDRSGQSLPNSGSMKGWSSAQITCFLDVLLSLTEGDAGHEAGPLHIGTLRAMDRMYGFSKSQNSEILFRYCRLAVAGEDETILPVVCRFITTQGRMKFVRPLYRALHQSKMGNRTATRVFLQNKDFYHPICAKLIASDLRTGSSGFLRSERAMKALGGTVLAAGVVAAGFVLLRRRK